jgi:hypothetical protein
VGELASRARHLRPKVRRRLLRAAGMDHRSLERFDGTHSTPRADVNRLGTHSHLTYSPGYVPAIGMTVNNCFLPRFVYELSHAVVDPASSLVYGSDRSLVLESSSWPMLWQLASYPYPKTRSNSRFLEGTFVFMPVSGFYHWLIEDLPVFLRSIESAPDARVLVPSRAPGYVWSALNWLGHDDAIEIDKRISVEKLVMTGKSDYSGTNGANVHPVDIGVLRERFRSLIPARPIGHRLVSLRAGYKRAAEDEHDLVRRLSARGFEGVDASALSFPEQITLFANTEHLVGLHGAGLSNSVWMHERAKVTEIFSSKYMVPCYATLAAVRGLQYRHYVYPPDSEVLGEQAIEEVVSGIDT